MLLVVIDAPTLKTNNTKKKSSAHIFIHESRQHCRYELSFMGGTTATRGLASKYEASAGRRPVSLIPQWPRRLSLAALPRNWFPLRIYRTWIIQVFVKWVAIIPGVFTCAMKNFTTSWESLASSWVRCVSWLWRCRFRILRISSIVFMVSTKNFL